MAIYGYRCLNCADIEVAFPIGTAPATVPCPACGASSTRVFTAPMLTRTPTAIAAQMERAERTAFEPEVVTSVPPRRAAGTVAVHPATSRLPRP